MTDGFPPLHYADWLARHALSRPATPALVAPTATLTYLDVHRRLHVFAHRLAESGIRHGQTVGISVANMPLHTLLLLALNRMGCVPISLQVPSAGAMIRIPDGLRVDSVLVGEPFAGIAPPGAVPVHFDWLKIGDEPVHEWQGPGLPSADAPAHIFASSGTTGTPKAMVFSTRQLETRLLRNSIGVFTMGRYRRLLSMFGMDVGVTYGRIMQALWPGTTLYFGWPDSAVPELIASQRIDWITASPSQYQAILRSSDPAAFNLSPLRAALVSGSTTPAPLVAAIRARLCGQLTNVYGATESGFVSFGPLREDMPPGRCGLLCPWVQAETVDENDTVLPPGAEGILRFRTEGMAAGYLNDAQTTAATFRHGWYYPGDIGVIGPGRDLTVLGRATDRINAGGIKASPDDIENVLLEFPGIAECAAFTVPGAMGVEVIWAAIVSTGETDLKALAAHCTARLGARAPARFLTLASLPRNPASKVIRAELRKLAQQSAN